MTRTRLGRRQLAAIGAELAGRDRAILADLQRWRLLTTNQIQRLHFPAEQHTLLSGPRLTRRSLQRLAEHHLIQPLERRIGGVRAGSAATVWSLSSAGQRLIEDRRPRRRVHEPTLVFLAHTLDVAEVYVLLQAEGRHYGLTIQGVEAEPDCWRRYVTSGGATLSLKPDLRLILGLGGEEHHWMVEVDRSSESQPRIARKAGLYLAYARAGHEQRRFGVFPRVLWLAPDDQRAGQLAQTLAAVPGAPPRLLAAAAQGDLFEALIGDSVAKKGGES